MVTLKVISRSVQDRGTSRNIGRLNSVGSVRTAVPHDRRHHSVSAKETETKAAETSGGMGSISRTLRLFSVLRARPVGPAVLFSFAQEERARVANRIFHRQSGSDADHRITGSSNQLVKTRRGDCGRPGFTEEKTLMDHENTIQRLTPEILDA